MAIEFHTQLIVSLKFLNVLNSTKKVAGNIEASNNDPARFYIFMHSIIGFVRTYKDSGLIELIVEKIKKYVKDLDRKLMTDFFVVFTEFLQSCNKGEIFDGYYRLEDTKNAINLCFLFLDSDWLKNVGMIVLIERFSAKKFESLCRVIQLIISSRCASK